MNNLLINNIKYSVSISSPIIAPKIYNGNYFNLSQIAQITIMGLNKENKNPFFRSSVKYYYPKANKSLDLDYLSEYKILDHLEQEYLLSESLIGLWTELHFRHKVHIHQFLYKHTETDRENFPFPPYTLNLQYSFDFVSAEFQKMESRNN